MSRYWLVATAVVAAILIDAPMLGITFVGDDAFRANIDGWLAIHHATLLDAFRAELFREDLAEGRFHPLFILLTLVEMHLVHDPFVLKSLQLFAVGLNVATVAFVAKTLTGSWSRGAAAAILTVLTLQFRNVYDATNGDALHLQVTAEFGLLSVGLLAYSLLRRHWTAWISYGASVLSFAAAVLTYEVMTPLILPLVALSVSRNQTWPQRIGLALPFIGVLLADIVVLGAVRHSFPQNQGTYYAPSFGVAYLQALLLQVVSTIPFIYEIVDPQSIFHVSGMYWPLVVLAALAVLGAMIAGTLLKSSGTRQRSNTDNVSASLLTGLALFGPAILVCASPIYQRQIELGLPYAPVYFQGFGLAITVAALLPKRISLLLPRLLLAVSIVLSLLVLFTANVVVAAQFDATKYARHTIVDGLLQRIADVIPTGALVFLDQSYVVNQVSYYGVPDEKEYGPLLWDSRYFYRLWSGRTWQTRPLTTEKLGAGQDAFEIRSVDNRAHSGTLVVQHVQGRGGLPPVLVSAEIFQRGASASMKELPIAPAFAQSDFTVSREGAGIRTMTFHPRCTMLPNDALLANTPSIAQISYGPGFSVLEHDKVIYWRWAGPQATLSIINDTTAALASELRMALGSFGAAHGTVSMSSPDGRQRIVIGGKASPIRMKLSLLPKSRIVFNFVATGPNVASRGDSRDIRFRVIDATLVDHNGCARGDAASGD